MMNALNDAIATLTRRLLELRVEGGHWEGRLSSSALSTATGAFALWTVDPHAHAAPVKAAVRWLVDHANPDGGWGDTVRSRSNLSTTLLCWCALRTAGAGEAQGAAGTAGAGAVGAAERWLAARAGGVDPARLASAVGAVYGGDRTFSAPILTMCALAGVLGEGREAWGYVAQLPFELAVLPHRLLRWARLPVVSYALPALIAVGGVRHHSARLRVDRGGRVKHAFASPLRWLRTRAWGAAVRKLQRIQPSSGGFLEAAPLTSFVTMCLASMGLREHPVVRRGVRFLLDTARDDGSWAIDTDLATWVTTLAVNALLDGEGDTAHPQAPQPRRGDRPVQAEEIDSPSASPSAPPSGDAIAADHHSTLDDTDREAILRWLLAQQHRAPHPYTGAAPGGWAWTDRSGGVPDADDTAGAVLALKHLGGRGAAGEALAGLRWLRGVQNRDGGIPTFCRGWGRLPFDRSCPDLTAHALRAWCAWRGESEDLAAALDPARLLRSLQRSQNADGSWTPLWFGNEGESGGENRTYGTARVLQTLAAVARAPVDPTAAVAEAALGAAACEAPGAVACGAQRSNHVEPTLPGSRGVRTGYALPAVRPLAARALAWLLAAQRPDGGWGGGGVSESSIEETALALIALCAAREADLGEERAEAAGGASAGAPAAVAASAGAVGAAIERGAAWLIERTARGAGGDASPIGLYFAQLWYYEDLYPLLFALQALRSCQRGEKLS